MPATILAPRYRREDRLIRTVLDLRPTWLIPCRAAAGPLQDLAGRRLDAPVTGSPTFGAALPSGRGITWSGSGQYATGPTDIPTGTAVSVLAILATTNATAAARSVVGRVGTGSSWRLALASGHNALFTAFQSGGSNHASAAPSGAMNDGAEHLVLGTFDGTTIRCARDSAAAATSTSLTGSWGSGSGTAVQIAAANSLIPLPGTTGLVAYWHDRIVSDAERLMIDSIRRGG